ncbi:hypothetical protein [Ferrimonas marina]|uniref:Uncharacterized protein n=1 Tax=Ferrimonas marina TaxID=299255 RepID=A0A1M5ZFU8_9GAMM|nr:hypothetical protein [Ferrimonas marina]SHI23011.1 hypothetical protein SAMN02745129_0233 [Ferrimonas marina]
MKSTVTDAQFFRLRMGKTALRALHVLGVAGASAGFLFGLDIELWRSWWILGMATGVALTGWEVWRSPLYLVQLKGVFTMVKVLLLALCYPFPQFSPMLFAAIMLLSVFIAHGPSQFRHYSIWHRRILRGQEIKG